MLGLCHPVFRGFMKLPVVLTAALSFMTTSSLAQTAEEAEVALNNVHHEMVRCIGYNTIVASCLRKRDGALADKYDKLAEHLLVLSNQIGQSIGMTEDAMNSRMTLEWSEMDKLIEHNCTNISSLTSRYAYRCKQVIENGDSILMEYLNK